MVWANWQDRNKFSQLINAPQPIERLPNVDGIRFPRWEIDSIGPDLTKDNVPFNTPADQIGNQGEILYDPTNGTISWGNIVRCG